MTDVRDDDPLVRERLRWLTRNMTAWALTLVLLLVAGSVLASYTLGLFTSESANLENVVSAGSMTQVNSADNAAIMSKVEMVPGEQVDGTATIRNAGDARGAFRLVVRDVEDDPGPGGGVLSRWLRLRVTEGDGTVVYFGPLDELDQELGTWEAEEERTYRFVVTFPESTAPVDNTYQRSTVKATFVWDAVQSR